MTNQGDDEIKPSTRQLPVFLIAGFGISNRFSMRTLTLFEGFFVNNM